MLRALPAPHKSSALSRQISKLPEGRSWQLRTGGRAAPSGASVMFLVSRMRMRMSSSSWARVFRGGGIGILWA